MAISRKRFAQLKAGDVVLYNGKPRVVQRGPGDKVGGKPSVFVTFVKLHDSWTNRCDTTQDYYGLKHVLSIPAAHIGRAKACRLETERCKSLGYNPATELSREIAEQERLESLGFNIPRRALRRAKRKLALLTRK